MTELRILRLDFEANHLTAEFTDGRRLRIALDYFPRLRAASPQQRADWRLIARGRGVHWEAVDEDLSVENLLTAYSRAKQSEYAAASA